MVRKKAIHRETVVDIWQGDNLVPATFGIREETLLLHHLDGQVCTARRVKWLWLGGLLLKRGIPGSVKINGISQKHRGNRRVFEQASNLYSRSVTDTIIDSRDGVRIAEMNALQFRFEGGGQIGRKTFVELHGIIDPSGVGHFQGYA